MKQVEDLTPVEIKALKRKLWKKGTNALSGWRNAKTKVTAARNLNIIQHIEAFRSLHKDTIKYQTDALKPQSL